MLADSLALLTSISKLDRSALENLLRTRFGKEPHNVFDLTDLVEQLLQVRNIKTALRSLNKNEIAVLQSLHPPSSKPGSATADDDGTLKFLRSQGLVAKTESGFIGLEAVSRELAKELESIEKVSPEKEQPADEHTTPENNWPMLAFLETQRLAVLLSSLQHLQLKKSKQGTPLTQDLNHLAETYDWDAPLTAMLFWVAKRLGFMGSVPAKDIRGGEVFAVTKLGAAWLLLAHAERWTELTENILKTSSVLLRDLPINDNRVPNAEEFKKFYPLLDKPQLRERETLFLALQRFGITVNDQLTPAAIAVKENNKLAATKMFAAELPAETTGVIVQPDFSVIVPGPLHPETGLKLLEMTNPVTVGVASSLEINKASLERAIRHGWSPSEVHNFLGKISLTEVPQPLAFMLSEMEQAKHPTKKQFAETMGDDATAVSDWASAVAERVWDSYGVSAEARYAQIIELAKKHKTALTIHVALTDTVEEIQVVPLSLSNSRLRARDTRQEIERVLPLSSVKHVSVAS